MGQCSSSSNGSKQPQGAAQSPARPSEDESHGSVKSPLRTLESRPRRALDERPTTPEAYSDDARKTKVYKDFGLAALRPSVDNDTCAALLALKTGRGSSVGGNYTHPSSVLPDEARGSNSSAMAAVPEDNSVTYSRPAGGSNDVGGAVSRVEPAGSQYRTDQATIPDSSERLERLMLSVQHGWTENVAAPKLPAS